MPPERSETPYETALANKIGYKRFADLSHVVRMLLVKSDVKTGECEKLRDEVVASAENTHKAGLAATPLEDYERFFIAVCKGLQFGFDQYKIESPPKEFELIEHLVYKKFLKEDGVTPKKVFFSTLIYNEISDRIALNPKYVSAYWNGKQTAPDKKFPVAGTDAMLNYDETVTINATMAAYTLKHIRPNERFKLMMEGPEYYAEQKNAAIQRFIKEEVGDALKGLNLGPYAGRPR